MHSPVSTAFLVLSALAGIEAKGGRGSSGRSSGGRSSLGSRGSVWGGAASRGAATSRGSLGTDLGASRGSSAAKIGAGVLAGGATGLVVGSAAGALRGSRAHSPWSSWSEPSAWSAWSPNPVSPYDVATAEPFARQRSSALQQAERGEERTAHTNEILRLATLSYTGSRVIHKVEERNAKVYLNKYKRYYWFGDRYYHNDPLAMRGSRTTCIFPTTPADNLTYTDDVPITAILFQCRKFDDICCQLDCCPNPYSRDYRSHNSAMRPSLAVFISIAAALISMLLS